MNKTEDLLRLAMNGEELTIDILKEFYCKNENELKEVATYNEYVKRCELVDEIMVTASQKKKNLMLYLVLVACYVGEKPINNSLLDEMIEKIKE